jgi:hypothetical protein
MEAKEVVVETQGTEDGSDLDESRPQNAEVTVDILEETT